MVFQFAIHLLTACLLLTATSLVSADDSVATEKSVTDIPAAPKSDSNATSEPDTSSDANSAAGVLLRFSFQEGEILRYRMTQVGELKATVREKTESTLTRVEQVRRFTVTAVDESHDADVQMKFESVRMSVRADDGQPVIYYNGMKAAEVPRIFRETDFRIRRGPVPFVARPMGPAMNTEAYEEAGKSESQEDLEPPHVDVAIPLPEVPVTVGETWTSYAVVPVRIREGVMRNIRLLTTWKLASFENNEARITFSTSPERTPRSPLIQGQLIDAYPRGHVVLNTESGKLTKRVIRNEKSVYHAAGPDTAADVISGVGGRTPAD